MNVVHLSFMWTMLVGDDCVEDIVRGGQASSLNPTVAGCEMCRQKHIINLGIFKLQFTKSLASITKGRKRERKSKFKVFNNVLHKGTCSDKRSENVLFFSFYSSVG